MQKDAKKAYLNNSTLIVLAFAVVFYARIVASTIHLSLLNLLHFMIVPAVCVIAITTTRTKDPKQIAICYSFLRGCLKSLFCYPYTLENPPKSPKSGGL